MSDRSCPVGDRHGNIDFGRLLDDQDELRWRSRIHSPYGDGCAAPRIAAALRDLLGLGTLAAAG